MAVRDLPPPPTTSEEVVAGGGQNLKIKHMFYTYVLLCSNKESSESEFYIGSTTDLRNRVIEHKSGEIKTTRKFDKVSLVYYECCVNKTDARKRELQLKTGFGRGYLRRRLESYLKDARM
ncbi:MAG: GIY-YIG nuclease family protein [Candidatus Spechtbacteria bacterium]|nr:GIY-YIG nuclease family protein [Candidatus Spechtbacteria bacterium]